tara:strand:- start:904 stop:1227 length:324 start_codon:yes stop_codon:yes gene_type:complete
MAMYNDNFVSFNLNELVSIRASFLQEELDEYQIDEIASHLRKNLTWDTLYGMVDDSILDHLDKLEKHYGETMNEAWLMEIERNKKQFEMVDLVAPSWTIQVPRRKKK